jgi:Zn-dependent oligopeptidase
MQHLKNRKLRETIYKAYITRASSGDQDNTPIIQDILRKKKAMAKMLVSDLKRYHAPYFSLGIPNVC